MAPYRAPTGAQETRSRAKGTTMSYTRGDAATLRADHERWQAEALRSIKRERFSRVTGPLYRERVASVPLRVDRRGGYRPLPRHPRRCDRRHYRPLPRLDPYKGA